MEIGRSFTVVLPSLTKPFSDADALKGKALNLMVKNYPGGALSPWLCNLKSGNLNFIAGIVFSTAHQ